MPRTKDQASRNVGGTNNNSGRDKGKDTKGPSFSVKGFTSKDPANVARNREGASRYATKSERIAASGRDSNADKAAARMSAPVRPGLNQSAAAAAAARNQSAAAAAAARKVGVPPAAPKPGMLATKAPPGYRPGIDPEYNYRAGAPGAATTPMAPRPAMAAMAAPVARVKPTITLAKGGKAPRKKK